MKRMIVLLTALVLSSIGIAGMASAQSYVNVSPQTINAGLHDVFTINITVDPEGYGVYTASYDLYFDFNALNAVSQTQGTFLGLDGAETIEVVNKFNNTIGKVTYCETRSGENGTTAPDILSSITFKVVGAGVCNLDLENVALVNSSLEAITGVKTTDGTCTIKNVTTLLIEPSQQDVMRGNVFTIDIVADPKGEPVYAVQYKLLFNMTMLNVTAQTSGDFLSKDGSSTEVQWNTLNNTTGEITYKEIRIGNVGGVTDRGILTSITFEAIGGPGTCSLDLSEVILSNSTDPIEPILIRNATLKLYLHVSVVSADNLDIGSAEGEHGAIVQIPVNITNVVNGPIQAIGFDVLYNHSILKLDYDNDDALLNGDLTAVNNWISILGTNERSITLATSNQSQAIQNGLSGSVVLLNFTVIGDAGETTSLELSDIEFSDPSGYNLGTAPAINGTFTVAGTVAGEAKPQKPFLIYGSVWYDDETPCNNPGVSITNLGTSEEWAAETSSGSNYYQITLTSGIDLNAGEMLRFNATDGTSTNLTDHTITADDVNNGGLFGFNLTLESIGDPAPHLVTYTISNTTISPNGDGIMDDTEIDVKFSEPVDATILIENVTGVVKSIYTSSSKVTDPTPKTWDGTDDIGNTVADGVYHVNVTMDDGVNPMVYDNTRSITVATLTADPPPSLVTYTISNSTISPNGDGIMDDTEIDVKFSESVDAAILIENATGVVRSLYISPDDVTDPEPQTWNGTDEGSNIVAYGTYQVNVTMDDGVNPIVYDNTRSIMVANMSVATISIGDGCGIVTIPIEIENGADVGACDIILSYDPAIVNVTGVTGGDMDVTVANLEHAGDGWVRIGTYQTDNPGLSGQITFANVTFEPVGSSGNCSLNLSVTTFKDVTPDGNPMPYVVSNGTYMALLNGDVNGDGVVDMHDAMYLAKHVLGKSGFDVIITEAADVNDDKVIDIADSMHIAKYVLGITGFELR